VQRAALALGRDPKLRPLDALNAWMEKRRTLRPVAPAMVDQAVFLENSLTGSEVDIRAYSGADLAPSGTAAVVWHAATQRRSPN
jgi:hypothetical protein